MKKKIFKNGVSLAALVALTITSLSIGLVGCGRAGEIEKREAACEQIKQFVAFSNADESKDELFSEITFDSATNEILVDGNQIENSVTQKLKNAIAESENIESCFDNEIYEVKHEGSVTTITSPYQTKKIMVAGKYDGESYGAVDSKYSDVLGFTVLKYGSEKTTKEAYEKMKTSSKSKCVVSPVVRAFGDVSRDYWVEKNWGYSKMHFATAVDNDIKSSDADVTVAILDTGLTPAFNIFENRISRDSYNFVDNNSNYADDNDQDGNHGTHVAGIVALETPQNVDIMVLKVLGGNGTGSFDAVIAGMIYASEKGAQVVNCSLGANVNKETDADIREFVSKFDGVQQAFNRNGTLFVAAAGNAENGKAPIDAKNTYPAALPYVYAVSAITQNDTLADFSNFGDTIEFCAPGKDIVSTSKDSNHAVTMSGTSQAAPMVAAALSDIFCYDDSLSGTEVYEIAKSSVVDIGTPGKDSSFGYGYIDMDKVSSAMKLPQDVSKMTLSIEYSTCYFNGEAKTPSVTLKDNGTVVAPSNYTVSYSNNTNVGTATVTVTGKGDYVGSINRTFAILGHPMKLVSAGLKNNSYQYTGNEIKPELESIKDYYGRQLNSNFYTVSYLNNVNVGTSAGVVLTGKNGFSGTKTLYFEITPASSDSCQVTIPYSSKEYTGHPIEPVVTVSLNGKIIETGYSVSYLNNVNAGTATVKVTGNGAFTGTKEVNFTITPKNISSCIVSLDNNSYAYTGSAITPKITVKTINGTELAKADYTVQYSDNVNPGSCKVTITGTGNYTGSVVTYFSIYNPDQFAIVSMVHADDGIQIKWTKDNGADGYVIYRKPIYKSGNEGDWVIVARLKNGSQTSYTDAKKKIDGLQYRYKVVSTKNGAEVNETGAKEIIFMVKPVISSVTRVSNGIKVTLMSNYVETTIRYSTNPDMSDYKTIVVPTTQTEIVITGLDASKTYYFTAQANASLNGVNIPSEVSARKLIQAETD